MIQATESILNPYVLFLMVITAWREMEQSAVEKRCNKKLLSFKWTSLY